MKTLVELNEEIAAKSRALHAVFEEAGPGMDMALVKSLEGDSKGKVEKIQAMNKDLDALVKEREPLAEMDAARRRASDLNRDYNEPSRTPRQPGGEAEVKSIGQLFVESKEYKSYKGQRKWPTEFTLDMDMKTLFQTGAGWTPAQVRLPGVVLSAQRPIGVIDFFPQFPTSQNVIRYMKETTFTSTNVVEKAEQTSVAASDVVGEAALAVTETSDEVEWVPAFIPVTMQQLEDVEGVEAYLSQRLTYMLQARLDLQCIQGTGVTPLLLGTNNLASVLSQAKGADPTPDAFYKAMTQVRATGFAEPSAVFIHPNDWQDIRLLRTADGIYIFGSPMDTGPERMWGVPVHVTTAALEGTGTLGDYRNFAAIYSRRGIQIAVSDSHAFYFTRGTLAIRADMRVAVVHTRDTAFCKVTGI